ncbi:hypothetical protein ACF0H5_017400 [Mactra antiquata]
MNDSFLESLSKMSLFGGRAYVKLLTTICSTQYENGRYTLSFDAIKGQDERRLTSIKNKRREENYKELACIAAPCSGDFDVSLTDNKCVFKFTVSGALKPSSPLEKGEDVVEYNHKQVDSRKILHLSPTYDEGSGGEAVIKFWYNDVVKHSVIIHNVPVTKLSTSGSSASGFEGSQTQQKYLDLCDGETISQGTVRTSGRGASFQNMAIGEPPRPQGPTYVPAQSPPAQSPVTCMSEEYDEYTDKGNTAFDKILSNTSLQNLVYALTPQDCSQLHINLNVPHSIIQTNNKNHPGDISTANYHSLLHWRGENNGSNQPAQNRNKALFEELVDKLDRIKRRDIAETLKTVIQLNKELDKSDFKHI